jgi:hypothetical protein
MAEKSILEQALLQIENLEEAMKQNSKGILGSVVKQELNGLLKESMNEKSKKGKKDIDEMPEMDEQSPEEDDVEKDDESSDSVDGVETPNDMRNSDDTSDDDDDDDDYNMSDDTSDDDDRSDDMSDDMSDDEDMSNDDDMSDDTVMDMTKASDAEVVKVFRAMKPEDGIVVKRDGNNLDISIDGDEYVIKLDEVPNDDMDNTMDDEIEEDMNEEMGDDMMDDSEENVYEIELDGSDEDTEKVEATEAARTKWNPHGDKGEAKRAGLKSKKMFKAGSGSLNEEVTKLRKQNGEYKKALVLFKEKLNDVAVFNANLAYATRLFTEHSTTKQEKLNILKRFDSASLMSESKKLYITIKAELNSKKPVTESVADKISATPKSSSSKEVLAESKAYENPQFKRMKELMAKIK